MSLAFLRNLQFNHCHGLHLDRVIARRKHNWFDLQFQKVDILGLRSGWSVCPVYPLNPADIHLQKTRMKVRGPVYIFTEDKRDKKRWKPRNSKFEFSAHHPATKAGFFFKEKSSKRN